jgi:hypothetical protein
MSDSYQRKTLKSDGKLLSTKPTQANTPVVLSPHKGSLAGSKRSTIGSAKLSQGGASAYGSKPGTGKSARNKAELNRVHSHGMLGSILEPIKQSKKNLNISPWSAYSSVRSPPETARDSSLYNHYFSKPASGKTTVRAAQSPRSAINTARPKKDKKVERIDREKSMSPQTFKNSKLNEKLFAHTNSEVLKELEDQRAEIERLNHELSIRETQIVKYAKLLRKERDKNHDNLTRTASSGGSLGSKAISNILHENQKILNHLQANNDILLYANEENVSPRSTSKNHEKVVSSLRTEIEKREMRLKEVQQRGTLSPAAPSTVRAQGKSPSRLGTLQAKMKQMKGHLERLVPLLEHASMQNKQFSKLVDSV